MLGAKSPKGSGRKNTVTSTGKTVTTKPSGGDRRDSRKNDRRFSQLEKKYPGANGTPTVFRRENIMLFLSVVLVAGFFVQGLYIYEIRGKVRGRASSRFLANYEGNGLDSLDAGDTSVYSKPTRRNKRMKRAHKPLGDDSVPSRKTQAQPKEAERDPPPPPPPDPPAAVDVQRDAEGLPVDFDWRAYLTLYPDLEATGIVNEELARRHYKEDGEREGRIYKRMRVILRYTSCTGLMNQHYSHIDAFALSAMLGAEIVLPPGAKRSSYADKTSLFKEQNIAKWMPVPMESLWDVDYIVKFWADKGMKVHPTPALEPFPDLSEAEISFPLYDQPGINPDWIVRMENVYIQPTDLDDLAKRARTLIFTKAGELLRTSTDSYLTVVLDLPCAFFMVKTSSKFKLIEEVARSLEFAPQLKEMANLVIDAMTENGAKEFNSVHLRVEKDAEVWADIMGGKDVVWNGYNAAMKMANFNTDTILYVASALLTYGAKQDLLAVISKLKSDGFCSEVHFKEMYLPQKELQLLHSEQVALVDFLVLAAGKTYVGFGASTFSFYLREYRLLQGLPRDTTVLVNASVITTDPLFYAAALVAPFN